MKGVRLIRFMKKVPSASLAKEAALVTSKILPG
jgi:hypothetical protein